MKRRMMVAGVLVALAACTGDGETGEPKSSFPHQLLPEGAREAPCAGTLTTMASARYERFCYLDANGQLQTIVGID